MYLKLNNKEFTLFYDSKNNLGKQTLAYSKTLSQKINKQDLNKTKLSMTVLRILINTMGIKAKSLMNKSHPYYQKNLKGKNFDENDWLTILQQNLHLIKAPIAYTKNKAILCETPTDVFKMLRNNPMFS